ncbi:FolC bifunctional protein [Mycena polygramma]|nr:FolC bifunctional protein [Mycena polygramma]
MFTRTYRDAIDSLNSLQTNAAALELVRASGGRSSAFAIPEMIEYLDIIGYKPADLNALNVIHITGTKGKGSTSAFTDSILRAAHPEWTTGLYTSPHLVAEDFAKYFFQVWDRIDENKAIFDFMTLVAYHTFLSLKVDATILEVGVGGTYDSTNIVPTPVTTGITALGIDHVAVLGKTLKEIAWHKGGIFKEGVPALTVNQPSEALDVLRQQAQDLKASEFKVVAAIPGLSQVKLGLAGTHQIQNATLAVHLARSFLQSRSPTSTEEVLTDDCVRGLENARWPGRDTTWYLDGAHTLESLECCVQWFVNPDVGLRADVRNQTNRVLIFNCTNGRSGATFLESMYSHIAAQLKLVDSVESAHPSSTMSFSAQIELLADLTTLAIPEADLAQLKTQHQLASAWASLIPAFPTGNIHVLPSIEHSVNLVRQLETDTENTDVLVAGSLHLVGGVIEVAGLSFSL